MTLERWNPAAELRRMDDLMNRIWRGFGSLSNGAEAPEQWAVPLDVVRDGDNVVVTASLPGVDPSKIDVTVEDGVLTIKAESSSEEERKEGEYLLRERRSGSFYRAVRLPETVDQEKAATSYRNGVLTVTFPKGESKKARRLAVTAG